MSRLIYLKGVGKIVIPNYTFLSLKHGENMSSLVDFVFHQTSTHIFSGDVENAHEKMLSSVEMISKFPGINPFEMAILGRITRSKYKSFWDKRK